jgi:hypothetical protein
VPLVASYCPNKFRCLRLTAALASLLLILLAGGRAQAFPSMIRHGYNVCQSCHADPSGAGLLTAYGRGLAETVLRTHWRKTSEEDDPGKISNFLFGLVPTPDWLLLQADGRGLTVVPLAPRSDAQFYLMQADLAAQVKIHRFRANGSLGFANKGALPASVTRGNQQLENRLVSRTYWLGVDLGADEQFLLRAGRMNLPFGVRSIEHTMFVRKTTRTNINDQQQEGVALAWNGSQLRAEVMAILGNFQLRPDDFRERGYSAYLEWALREKLALGVSSLIVHSNLDTGLLTPLWRQVHGIFARWSPHEKVALTAESNLLFFSQPPAGIAAAHNVGGNASAVNVDYEPFQGVHLLGAAELQNKDIGTSSTDYGLWAGAWWFVLPHLDLRADVSRLTVSSQNITSFLFQFHGYW